MIRWFSFKFSAEAEQYSVKYTLFTAIYLMWALMGGCSDTETPTRGPDSAAESSAAAVTTASTGKLYPLSLSSKTIQVELACTPAEQSKGLMFRESLPSDQGMLFIFQRKQTLAFWMKNTLIPLDIGYFDQSGTLVDIQTMMANTTQTYPSKVPAQYALEMNAGWFAENGIAEGLQIALPDCPEKR